MNNKEYMEKARALFSDAKAILEAETVTAEDQKRAAEMVEDAKKHMATAQTLLDIKGAGAMVAEAETKVAAEIGGRNEFKSLGQFLVEVAQAGNLRYRGQVHPALKRFFDPDEPADEVKATMVENVGARGGFLVPPEYRNQLLFAGPVDAQAVRGRATVIPMSGRQALMPALDQTGTTANQFHWFGGVIAYWTEEQGTKTQSEPTFRQVSLVAHKLVTYSRSSDELLADSGIGLAAFLGGAMGFPGAINAYEEYAFLRGTGVGQPLGVINAGCTITVARQATNPAIGIVDLLNMLEKFLATGGRGVWMITQAAMSTIAQINGPSGNASYVFIPNAREGLPATLFGMPVIWTEKLPAEGSAGDVLLANWPYYLIGDRQRTTIESTNAERFQYDETSWRCVHRVGGLPWLSAPLTLFDGSAQVSPFVILGAKST